jgi:hypothetical protein
MAEVIVWLLGIARRQVQAFGDSLANVVAFADDPQEKGCDVAPGFGRA